MTTNLERAEARAMRRRRAAASSARKMLGVAGIWSTAGVVVWLVAGLPFAAPLIAAAAMFGLFAIDIWKGDP